MAKKNEKNAKRAGKITLTPIEEQENEKNIPTDQVDVSPKNAHRVGKITLTPIEEQENEKNILTDQDDVIKTLQKPIENINSTSTLQSKPNLEISYPIITENNLPYFPEVENFNLSNENASWSTIGMVGVGTAIANAILSNIGIKGQLRATLNHGDALPNEIFKQYGIKWLFMSNDALSNPQYQHHVNGIGVVHADQIIALANSIIKKTLISSVSLGVIGSGITAYNIDICNYLSKTSIQKFYDFKSIVINNQLNINTQKSNIELENAKKETESMGEFGKKLYKVIYKPAIDKKYDLLNKVSKGILTPKEADALKAKHVTIDLETHKYEHCILQDNYDNNGDYYNCYSTKQEKLDHVIIDSDNNVKVTVIGEQL